MLLMEGLRNHNYIIPRPRQIIKGNMDENAVNRPSCSTADFLPGALQGRGGGLEVYFRCRPGSFRAKAFEDGFFLFRFFLVIRGGRKTFRFRGDATKNPSAAGFLRIRSRRRAEPRTG